MSESVNGATTAEAPRAEPATETITPGRTITEADLVSFAALTGDWHPQHADAEWAGRGRFGARVAHGMLVLSYAVGLVPFDPERVVALRGLESISFKRPVHIGDTIRVASVVEGTKRLDDEHSLVTLAWRVLNQDDRVVARAKVNALWRSEGGTANGAVAAPDDADLTDLYGERLAL
ncbi:MAG TPA: MaoC/PaaZ C-terminal domain-containing protein [Solirubrobacterales bacterium]|jgi:acyl dehydratase|nr:MaoC/PaaZ C-terminal domain-containing protein [Solirubrobacterales bacterium]